MDRVHTSALRKKAQLTVLALTCVLCHVGALAASDVADAVMHRDAVLLEKLIASHADVNAAQPDGSTALHWAAYHGDASLTTRLLGARANPAAVTGTGMTPLALACESGNEEVVRLLLKARADPNQALNNGETPLMMAARTGSVPILKRLLARGAKIDAREKLRGTTALMWAAASSNTEAVRLLIAKGADINARSATIAPGRRPYIAPPGRERIQEFIDGTGLRGAVVEEQAPARDSAGSALEEQAPARDSAGSALEEQAPARDSAGSALEEQVPEGGSAGSGSATSGSDRHEPDARAAAKRRFQAEIAAAKEAIAKFGSTAAYARRGERQWGGLTPLLFAAREGSFDTVKALLDAGVDVNQVSEYGWTALLAATHNRFYRLGVFLLERGANPNLANEGGWNPLYLATDNRNIEAGDYPTRRPDMDHLEFIQRLLAAGADPNQRMRSSTETRTVFTHQWLYEEGATPFLRTAQSGDVVLMKLLLEKGADPSIATDHEVTPLMVASGIGWVEGVTYEWSPQATYDAVKLLLDLGADVNAQDTLDGRTALMGAAHKGRNDIIELLARHGADLSRRDIGSRDSIHALAGVTWQAIDYADGLVRVGVQSAIAHPETSALLRRLMKERGLAVPAEGRTLASICVTELCK